MEKCISAIFLMLMSTVIYADDTERLWSWYFSGITSREPNTEVIIRQGTARVTFGTNSLQIDFNENDMPNFKAVYNGSFKNGRIISGKLNGFFFHGTESWNGVFNKKEAPKGCEWEEILLRSGVFDGSVLMLSRVKGCRVVSDEDKPDF